MPHVPFVNSAISARVYPNEGRPKCDGRTKCHPFIAATVAVVKDPNDSDL
jgi:hypothetical protein